MNRVLHLCNQFQDVWRDEQYLYMLEYRYRKHIARKPGNQYLVIIQGTDNIPHTKRTIFARVWNPVTEQWADKPLGYKVWDRFLELSKEDERKIRQDPLPWFIEGML